MSEVVCSNAYATLLDMVKGEKGVPSSIKRASLSKSAEDTLTELNLEKASRTAPVEVVVRSERIRTSDNQANTLQTQARTAIPASLESLTSI